MRKSYKLRNAAGLTQKMGNRETLNNRCRMAKGGAYSPGEAAAILKAWQSSPRPAHRQRRRKNRLMADFGYCADCNEMCYAPVKHGVYTRAHTGFNHHSRKRFIVFDKPPDACPPPIRAVLMRLQVPVPDKRPPEMIHNEMILFRLALDLEGMLE